MSYPDAAAFGIALEHNLLGMEDTLEGNKAFNEKRNPTIRTSNTMIRKEDI